MRFLGVVLLAASLSGCGLADRLITNCSDPQPYDTSTERPPLKVPASVDAPNTRNALKIPETKGPERARYQDGRCLDEPPPFDPARPVQPDKKKS